MIQEDDDAAADSDGQGREVKLTLQDKYAGMPGNGAMPLSRGIGCSLAR